MRSPLPSFVLALGALLPAQDPSTRPTSPAAPAPAAVDPLAAAKQRLQQALQKTAGIADTAFTARWGPNDGKNPVQQFLTSTPPGGTKVDGSWHAGRLHAAFDGDQGDELVCDGRRTIAKDANTDWKLRRGRYADGNTAAFVPDPALLLQQLAVCDLAVKRAAVGTLDDRPIEILTVELPAEAVADATWSGSLPELNSWSGALFVQMAGGGRQANRPAAIAPDATVDLAVLLDPATGLVHEIRARAWSKAAAQGARQVMVAGGGVVRFAAAGAQPAAGADGDDEKETKETGPVDGSVIDDNGLPVRSRKNTSVTDFAIRLRDHGKKPAPALTDAQKRLLGL